MAIRDRALLRRATALLAIVSLGGCGDLDGRLYDRYRQRLAVADAKSAATWCATGRRPVFFDTMYQSRDEACRASNPSPEPPKTVYVEPPPDPPFPAPVDPPLADIPSDPPVASAPEPVRRALAQSQSSPRRVAQSSAIPANVVAICNAECPDNPVDTMDQDPHAVLERYRTLSCLQSCTYRELPANFPNRETYKKTAAETLDQMTKLYGKTASPPSP